MPTDQDRVILVQTETIEHYIEISVTALARLTGLTEDTIRELAERKGELDVEGETYDRLSDITYEANTEPQGSVFTVEAGV